MSDEQLHATIIREAERLYGTERGKFVDRWAVAASVVPSTVRCFLRNKPLKASTINKLIEPVGYEARLVIRKRRVS